MAKVHFRTPEAWAKAADAAPAEVIVKPGEGTVQVTKPAETPPEAHPWDEAHPKVVERFIVRLPQALHMKMAWLAEHLPKTSMHSIAIDAVSAHVEKLLAEHLPKGAVSPEPAPKKKRSRASVRVLSDAQAGQKERGDAA